MTRIPLSIEDTDGAYISPGTGNPTARPEAWVSVVFAALFLLATFWHCGLLVRWRSYFTWLFAASCLVQCFSLIEFAYSTSYSLSTAFLVTGTLAHWLSPTLLTIAIIVVAGRAIWAASLSNPARLESIWGFVRWNTLVITTSSLGAFALLCIGCIVVVSAAPQGEVTAANKGIVNAGNNVVIAGLVLQLIILAIFTVLVWRFRAVSRSRDVHWDERRRTTWTWAKLLVVVLVSLGLLFVRQTYHLIRFLLEWTGLPWLGLLFDAGPILIVTILLIIYHPGKCLPRDLNKLRLDKEGLRLRTQIPKVLVSQTDSTPSLTSGSISYA